MYNYTDPLNFLTPFGSKPNRAILLCPWETNFIVLSPP